MALIAWRTDLYTVGTAAFADPGWDRHAYRELARRDLLDFKLAPYCWRILVPWLAKAFPASLQVGFLSVTTAALIATGPATFALVRATGGSRPAAFAMVLAFYSLGWAARYTLADFWIPDATAMLGTVVSVWLIVTKRWWAACLVLAVGVLAKESVLFAGALAFTWHLRGWRDWQTVRRALLLVAPAILLLIGLRLAVQPENGNADYIATMPSQIARFPELFGEYSYSQRYTDIVVNDRWAHRELHDLDRYLFDSFGLPLLVVGVAGTITDRKRAVRLLPFVVLVYIQLLFATDTQRLLVLAFPVLAILGGGGIGWLAKHMRLPETAFVVVFAVSFGASLTNGDNFGADVRLGVLAMGVGLVAGYLAMRLRPIGNPEGLPDSPNNR